MSTASPNVAEGSTISASNAISPILAIDPETLLLTPITILFASIWITVVDSLFWLCK
jgi:hypothetical protein